MACYFRLLGFPGSPKPNGPYWNLRSNAARASSHFEDAGTGSHRPEVALVEGSFRLGVKKRRVYRSTL